MKLSEAVRKGCELTKPLRDEYIAYGAGGQLEACPLGAAWIAVRGPLQWEAPTQIEFDLKLYWNVLEERVPFAIDWGEEDVEEVAETTWLYFITELNDEYRWSRERIIQLLENNGL